MTDRTEENVDPEVGDTAEKLLSAVAKDIRAKVTAQVHADINERRHQEWREVMDRVLESNNRLVEVTDKMADGLFRIAGAVEDLARHFNKLPRI